MATKCLIQLTDSQAKSIKNGSPGYVQVTATTEQKKLLEAKFGSSCPSVFEASYLLVWDDNIVGLELSGSDLISTRFPAVIV